MKTEREQGTQDGIILMSQLAARSAADLAHTTNLLTENALTQALSLGESLLTLWERVNAGQKEGKPRQVDYALAAIDPDQVAETLDHLRHLLKSYERANRA